MADEKKEGEHEDIVKKLVKEVTEVSVDVVSKETQSHPETVLYTGEDRGANLPSGSDKITNPNLDEDGYLDLTKPQIKNNSKKNEEEISEEQFQKVQKRNHNPKDNQNEGSSPIREMPMDAPGSKGLSGFLNKDVGSKNIHADRDAGSNPVGAKAPSSSGQSHGLREVGGSIPQPSGDGVASPKKFNIWFYICAGVMFTMLLIIIIQNGSILGKDTSVNVTVQPAEVSVQPNITVMPSNVTVQNIYNNSFPLNTSLNFTLGNININNSNST